MSFRYQERVIGRQGPTYETGPPVNKKRTRRSLNFVPFVLVLGLLVLDIVYELVDDPDRIGDLSTFPAQAGQVPDLSGLGRKSL